MYIKNSEFDCIGIGTQMYDFLVPLYGQEHFNTVKETRKEPGSINLMVTEKNPIKSEHEKLSQLKQEGFGNIDASDNNLEKNSADNISTIEQESAANAETKIKKLGSIYDAMKKAKVQTSEMQFKPIKQKIKKFKTSSNKFHLV